LNESKDGEFPPVPFALLTRLEEAIPERCPELGMSDREIFHYAGQRSLVRMLREAYNEQQRG
jgi:hypothetical protein